MIYLHTGCKYSERWDQGIKSSLIKYHQKIQLCNIFELDLNKIKRKDCFMGRLNESCRNTKDIYPEVCDAFDDRTWPSRLEMDLYDDKFKQFKLLSKTNSKIPDTEYVTDKTTDIGIEFPLVTKLIHGSSGKNVGLAHNRESIPFPCIVQKYHKVDCDYRVMVIGDRTLAFKRHNSKEDFRASGSKNLEVLENIDPEIVRISNLICEKFNFCTMSFDFIQDEGEWIILEISYTYGITFYKDGVTHDVLKYSPFHVNKNNTDRQPTDSIFDMIVENRIKEWYGVL